VHRPEEVAHGQLEHRQPVRRTRRQPLVFALSARHVADLVDDLEVQQFGSELVRPAYEHVVQARRVEGPPDDGHLLPGRSAVHFQLQFGRDF
jgi:hypothetical protein